jgi:hypothetical protein
MGNGVQGAGSSEAAPSSINIFYRCIPYVIFMHTLLVSTQLAWKSG